MFKNTVAIFLLLLATFNTSEFAAAASYSSYSGYWYSGSSWYTGGIPNSTTDAIIGSYLVSPSTITIIYSGQECYHLWLGMSSGNKGTLNINSGSLRGYGRGLIGKAGEGYVNQYGGIVTLDSMYLGDQGKGVYELKNGWLEIDYNEIIGYSGEGTLNQSSGTNLVSSLYLAYNSASANGVYNLSGGILQIMKGINSLHIGRSGNGKLYLGDEFTTATVMEVGTSTFGVSLYVREGTLASGLLQGWGYVDFTRDLNNNGRIVADGYGTERDLDLSSFSRLQNNDSIGIIQGDGTTSGWYAINKGKLILPDINITTGDNEYNWGEEHGDDILDLVNSVKLVFSGVASDASISGSLVATDRSYLPFIPHGSTIIGLWEFSDQGSSYDHVDLAFRYDNNLCDNLGINENDLRVYKLSGFGLADMTSTIDIANKCIIAEGIPSLSYFAVGVVPESPLPGDFEEDGDVDLYDFNHFANHWLDVDCNDITGDENNWCNGADIDRDGFVGLKDFAILANYWLK